MLPFSQFLTEAPNLKHVLAQVTEDLIAEMDSFDGPGVNDAWTINSGYCDQWVELAMKRLGAGEERWLDWDVDEDTPLYEHVMLLYRGRLYDSTHQEGIASIRDYVPETHDEWLARTR